MTGEALAPLDPSGERPDFVEAITADHRKIRQMFERVRQGRADDPALLSELAVEVATHLRSEELVLFSTLTAREAARVLPTKRIWSESVLGEWARLYLRNQQMREALMFPLDERERSFLVHCSFCESRVLPQLARHEAAVRADLGRRYVSTVLESRAEAKRELVGLRVWNEHAACESPVVYPSLPDTGAMVVEQATEQASVAVPPVMLGVIT